MIVIPMAGRSQRFFDAGYTAPKYMLDLHGNLRSQSLRRLAPGPWRTYHKRRLERALLITTKRDRYRGNLPVPERYFEAARELEVEPDGGPPDFFISEEADCRAAE